ncbi:hypothetical protein [Paenibacillus maysiensis]|uniref:hypothetical protein n=1 Tax=Paenibacillus maysiensis TaxID=1155954 RepID=UPI0004700E63|nr:hypothetical protein [Paenibacillus maysiensis]
MKKWIAPVFSLSLVIPGVAGAAAAAAAPTTVNISKPAVATPAMASNVEQRLSSGAVFLHTDHLKSYEVRNFICPESRLSY